MASKRNPWIEREVSQQQTIEVRELWQDWDPIGVMDKPGTSPREYDSYLDPTMRLLERGASIDEIEAYLEWVAYKRMGLVYIPVSGREFARVLRIWYTKRWLYI